MKKDFQNYHTKVMQIINFMPSWIVDEGYKLVNRSTTLYYIYI